MAEIPQQRLNVLHIVDSLAAGGAERVAVNLSNVMPRDRYKMHLCATRQEGPLAELIAADVGRLSLGRKRRFEWSAIKRLADYAREQRIHVFHAHSSSLFIASLASLLPPRPIVIWHDHFGRPMGERSAWVYRLLTQRTDGVVAVNESLAEWSRVHLRLPRVWYLPNFVPEPNTKGSAAFVDPLGATAGARIVCVANFRQQKDHVTLLEALAKVKHEFPTVRLYLIGTEVEPEYVSHIRAAIIQLELAEHVSILGSRADVAEVLRVCDMGVLSSKSEGLPLALLEYGVAGLAVVVTRVGQCAEVVQRGDAGVVVDPASPQQLSQGILELLRDPERRRALGSRLQARVRECYSAASAVRQLDSIYATILGGPL